MRIQRFVLALLVLFVPIAGLRAQLAALSLSRTGDVAYSTPKDTLGKFGVYAAGLDGRNFYQARRGFDGTDIVGLFAGRDLIEDSYHANMHVFLSGGLVAGSSEKGPALELLMQKASFNDIYVAEFRSEYGWGVSGTQNFARNSLTTLYLFDNELFIGGSTEVIYRPRSVSMTFERADLGPMVRVVFGPTFVQAWHTWSLRPGGEKRLTLTIGFNPM